MTTPRDDEVDLSNDPMDPGDGREHSEEPAEGEGTDGLEVPREHSEDAAEG